MTDEIGTDFAGTPDITPEQLRDACLRLAGKALKAARGDWETAKAMLRPVLEAVGAIEYAPGLLPDQWGTRRNGDKRGRVQS